jgi:cyclopropane-fatty-acyl-phospholipid synthase
METTKISSNKSFASGNSLSLTHTLGKKFFLSFIKKIKVGTLHIITNEGERYTFGNDHTVQATIEIKDNSFFDFIMKFGDVGFGEAYVLKYWDTHSIYDVIKLLILNLDHLTLMSGSKKKAFANILSFANRIQHLFRSNTHKGALENISKHYDLSNDFFKLWLDETMTYSSGLWTSQNQSLKEAQIEKWNRLIQKLQIQKSDHVLEIGTGWGGFALHLAKNVGCKISTTTISKQQYNYAKALFTEHGVNHLITLELKDYRDLDGKFDKIVSFEMMEAIGHEFMPTFIEKVSSLLNKKGMFGCQVITCPDSRYHDFRNGVDWIQKHIFPGSLLISVSHLLKLASDKTELQAYDLFDMGLHYEKTLLTWKNNFSKKLDDIKNLEMDELFIRKWFYYLDYCAAAFATRNISVVQLCMTNPNNTSLASEVP